MVSQEKMSRVCSSCRIPTVSRWLTAVESTGLALSDHLPPRRPAALDGEQQQIIAGWVLHRIPSVYGLLGRLRSPRIWFASSLHDTVPSLAIGQRLPPSRMMEERTKSERGGQFLTRRVRGRTTSPAGRAPPSSSPPRRPAPRRD